MAVVTDSAPAFPGIRAIVDGSEAVAHVDTRLSEVARVYPITPSTTMAAIYQAAVADGRADLWGTPLWFIEPESEHSSASAAEGVTLMREVLYVIKNYVSSILAKLNLERRAQAAAYMPRMGRAGGGS